MDFQPEYAVDTLRRAAEIIAARRSEMDAETLAAVRALVREYGPQIATKDSLNAKEQVRGLLEALWALRARLPVAAAQMLQAGAARPDGLRREMRGVSLIRLPDGERERLLHSLITIEDFRVFANPPGLADRVVELVKTHQKRLLPRERDAWRQLQELYGRTGDAEAFLWGVQRLLGDYSQVSDLLESGKISLASLRVREGVTLRGPQAKGVDIPGQARSALAPVRPTRPEAVVRYANVYFPATVFRSQQRVPLVVHVAQQAAEKAVVSPEQARLTLQLGDITLVVMAEGFEVADAIGGQPVPDHLASRRVKVEAKRDCEPVIFFLNPLAAGRKKISVEVRQADVYVATLAFETQVLEGAAITELNNVTVQGEVVAPGPEARPPDLELRITLSADKRTLAYFLHSPGSSHYHYKPVGQTVLERDPQVFLVPTFDQLSTLARRLPANRTPAQTAEAQDDQKRIGISLYDQLFPSEFKQEYRRLREWMAGDGRTAKSLLITSDEPWIPWEMVRPFLVDEEGNIVYDDPPLCERFQVSRWLAGRGAPERLAMQRGTWVAPADNLKAARVEAEYFAELHRREWDVALAGPLTTVSDVTRTFEAGNTQLFHFACHGNFASDDPNESALKLQGDYLRPSQIIGTQLAGLRRAKPLVFLNACESGEAGFALTQLGGWARRFLDAGASAFIGSLWEISDQLAAQFAREFYNRLWGINEHRGKPQPLGQAFREARLAIKAADPANPTWLAYVLYGDPLGRVVLGEPGAG